ncbi:MAG: hypothetical protein ABW195_15805, partial [Ilumatobacteraceae bacterium]
MEDEPAPDDIWDRLASRWASTSSVDARPRGFTTAKVYGQWVRDGEDPEVAGLESFFSADLRRLAEVEPNRTLRRYLAGVPRRAPADAVDIRNPSEQALALPVGSGPAGRWPARTGTLTTSQRIAVRHMDDRLDEPGHIVAVNGPPGTGKSTLLRELVAQQIVERAGVIADLGPNRAVSSPPTSRSSRPRRTADPWPSSPRGQGVDG